MQTGPLQSKTNNDPPNILAIVLETRATLTSLRDLIRNHNITIPNSLLLNAKVEIINTESRKGVDDFVDFNIGYDTSSEAAQQSLRWAC